jgi:hypothetical protein
MAAPGWYDDPQTPGGKRWWDGNQWTEHVAQPAAPQQAAPAPPDATRIAPAPGQAGAAQPGAGQPQAAPAQPDATRIAPSPAAGAQPAAAEPGATRIAPGAAQAGAGPPPPPGQWGAAQPAPGQAGYAQAPAYQRPAPTPAGPYPPQRIAVVAVAAFFAVLLIVGSIGTWVSVETTGAFHLSASRGGLSRDGAVTLTLAILILILVGVWAARVGPPAARISLIAVAAFLSLLGVIISIADVIDVQSNGTSVVDASAGWGLWLCVISSLVLLGTTLVGVVMPRLR